MRAEVVLIYYKSISNRLMEGKEEREGKIVDELRIDKLCNLTNCPYSDLF